MCLDNLNHAVALRRRQDVIHGKAGQLVVKKLEERLSCHSLVSSCDPLCA